MEDGPGCWARPKSPPARDGSRNCFWFLRTSSRCPQTLAAIANADLITIGPGSLFTSLIPNLLVRGIAKAIVESRRERFTSAT